MPELAETAPDGRNGAPSGWQLRRRVGKYTSGLGLSHRFNSTPASVNDRPSEDRVGHLELDTETVFGLSKLLRATASERGEPRRELYDQSENPVQIGGGKSPAYPVLATNRRRRSKSMSDNVVMAPDTVTARGRSLATTGPASPVRFFSDPLVRGLRIRV